MKLRLNLRYLAVIGLIAFWFLGIDWTWRVEDCPNCYFGRDVMQYRICTTPIHERTRVDDTLLHQVSIDLGIECRHSQMTHWDKHRWWGLCLCARPCINGMYRMNGGPVHSPAWTTKLKEMVSANPSLPSEFQERVLKEHDFEYWHAMIKTIQATLDEVDDAKTDP